MESRKNIFIQIKAGSDLKQLPDEKLLAEFLVSGNKDILATLLMRYMHMVYGVCLKYLADREAAKDAAMQLFEKLAQVLPDQEVNHFGSWLYVLTKNHCLMQLRSDNAFRSRNKRWMEEQENFVESDLSLHPLDSEKQVMEKRLKDCIEKLNEVQRQCIRLFYFENKCYREISEKTNTEEKKVKSHLQNGKRNLKLCLEEKHA